MFEIDYLIFTKRNKFANIIFIRLIETTIYKATNKQTKKRAKLSELLFLFWVWKNTITANKLYEACVRFRTLFIFVNIYLPI